MCWKPTQLIALATVIFFAACSKPQSEQATETQPAMEAAPAAEALRQPAAAGGERSDPTVVDPEHYTTEFENESVRVLRIKYGPGEESVMHYHPDSVAVFISDIEGQMIMPDGSTEEMTLAAGDTVFNPAGAHQPRNTSDAAWEVIEVELKPRDSAAGEPAAPDATVVDAEHYTSEFENEAVRIVRIKYGPGEESVMHYHPDSVAVFVTDQLVQMTMPDGSTEEVTLGTGDVLFMGEGQHLPKNISDAAWELVLVELK